MGQARVRKRSRCAAPVSAAALCLGLLLAPAGAGHGQEGGAPDREAALPGAQPEKSSALEQRILRERELLDRGAVLLPYRPNYFLPLSYNPSPNNAPFEQTGQAPLQTVEVQFQISLKAPLWQELFGRNGDLFIAYTQLSFWQMYNTAKSSFFRESDYEPEVFLLFDTNVPVLGMRNRLLSIGADHQSNGKGGDLSRSWNRVYAQFVLDRGNFTLSLKPWYRIPEDPEDDDNPDIGKYFGPGELHAVYAWKRHELGVLLRSNFRFSGGNKGAVQFEGSFPLVGRLKGYVQYFYGYGASLLDYDVRTNRVGVGIMLTDWL